MHSMHHTTNSTSILELCYCSSSILTQFYAQIKRYVCFFYIKMFKSLKHFLNIMRLTQCKAFTISFNFDSQNSIYFVSTFHLKHRRKILLGFTYAFHIRTKYEHISHIKAYNDSIFLYEFGIHTFVETIAYKAIRQNC